MSREGKALGARRREQNIGQKGSQERGDGRFRRSFTIAVSSADGQIRAASDGVPFALAHAAGRPKGALTPHPFFHLGTLGKACIDVLARITPDFATAPPEVFVSGRTLKHIEERRPGFLQKLGGLDGLISACGRVLPNPTAGKPWSRPWIAVRRDPRIALVVGPSRQRA